MVDLTTANNALKEAYLSAAVNQLNTQTNPLFAKIKQSSADVYGKEIIKVAPVGINGGIGAGTETGALPTASANNYKQLKSTLKNLYGKIEISDKAIRAGQHNATGFVNLLNAEMEGLLEASKFNLSRMLYGDGTGLLATIKSVSGSVYTLDNVKGIVVGMMIDTYNGETFAKTAIVTAVDYANKTIKASETLTKDHKIYVQGSRNNELTGLKAIFDSNVESIYGLTKANEEWLNPYVDTASSEREISNSMIQTAIDNIEELTGSTIDFISCGYKVKRAYQQYLTYYRSNVEIMNLDGGFKTLSYSGIPVVADRFVADDAMYLLNTKNFTLHQLCDWEWLEGENGRVLQQIAGKACYTATLVKYADLICDRCNGQGMIDKISGSVANPLNIALQSSN